MSIKHKATLAIVLRSVRASPMVRKWVTSRERITRAPVLISSQATNSANLIGSICCINALTESTTNAVSYSLIIVESYNYYKLIIIIKLNIVYYTLNMLFNEQIGKVHNIILYTSCLSVVILALTFVQEPTNTSGCIFVSSLLECNCIG